MAVPARDAIGNGSARSGEKAASDQFSPVCRQGVNTGGTSYFAAERVPRSAVPARDASSANTTGDGEIAGHDQVPIVNREGVHASNVCPTAQRLPTHAIPLGDVVNADATSGGKETTS